MKTSETHCNGEGGFSIMMFEKFTERGRKVIVYAREEAERLQNDYLGTEHVLLGTLREPEFHRRCLATLASNTETASLPDSKGPLVRPSRKSL